MRTTLHQQLRSKSFRPESAKPASRQLRMLDDLNRSGFNNKSQNRRKLNISDDSSGFENSYRQDSRIEKERLQQEQYYLKTTVHQLQEDRVKLRTRIHQLEDSCLRNEKLLQEVDKVGPIKSQFLKFINETTLVNALKKQLIAAKDTIGQKEVELEKVKKCQKYTRVQEVLTEKQALLDETLRLKGLLESTLQASLYSLQQSGLEQEVQERLLKMMNTVQQLKLEQLENDKVIQRLKKQCVLYKSQQLDCEYKWQREVKKLREQLTDKAKEVESVRPNKKAEEANELLVKQINGYKEVISEKCRIIEELQSRLSLKINLIESESEECLESSPKHQLERQLTAKDDSVTPKSTRRELQVMKNSSVVEKPKRRVTAVAFADVRVIGETMKYRLIAMDIEQIDDYLFSENMLQQGESTYAQLKQQLQQFPFDLSAFNAVLVARYIVETDGGEPITDDTSQTNAFVKSVIRRLIGSYNLTLIRNAMERSDKLKDTLHRFKQFLISTIKQIVGSKSMRVSKEQFLDAITMLQLELMPHEVDYLIVQGIMESESTQSLNFMEMLKSDESTLEFHPQQECTPSFITQNDYIKVEQHLDAVPEVDEHKQSIDEHSQLYEQESPATLEDYEFKECDDYQQPEYEEDKLITFNQEYPQSLPKQIESQQQLKSLESKLMSQQSQQRHQQSHLVSQQSYQEPTQSKFVSQQSQQIQESQAQSQLSSSQLPSEEYRQEYDEQFESESDQQPCNVKTSDFTYETPQQRAYDTPQQRPWEYNQESNDQLIEQPSSQEKSDKYSLNSAT